MIVKTSVLLLPLLTVGCSLAAEIFRNAQFQCGIPTSTPALLIVNGVEARISDWPWHAAVRHHDDDDEAEYVCGGTLISERFVVTAAHCAVDEDGIDAAKMSVQLGVSTVGAKGGKIFNVRKIYRHPGFRWSEFKDDIALLELNSAVPFGDTILPACVSRKVGVESHQVGAVVGWGLTENKRRSSNLRLARLPVVDQSECKQKEPELYGRVLSSKVFCAGYANGTSPCNGDSGSAIVFERGDAWYLGGVVSFIRANSDDTCLTTTYTVFTKLTAYLDWIEQVTHTDFSTEYAIEKPVKCSTPGQPNGQCVPVQQCRNLFDELRSPLLTKEKANSIRQSVCQLRGIRRSICCDPRQVERIPIHRNAALLPLDCGVARQQTPTATAAPAGVSEFPWVALVRYSRATPDKDRYCTGSLINNRYVLTSASCLKQTENRNMDSVRFGARTIGQSRDCDSYSDPRNRNFANECSPSPIDVKAVLPFTFHPQANKDFRQNDLALVRLQEKVQFSDTIQPVCLPIRENLRNNLPQDFTLSLFETVNRKGLYATELYKTRSEFRDKDECEERYEDYGYIPWVSEGVFCALALGPKFLCSLNLGSPLIAMVPHGDTTVRAVLYGLAMQSPDNCTIAQTIPKTYIQVPSYVDWILENISK